MQDFLPNCFILINKHVKYWKIYLGQGRIHEFVAGEIVFFYFLERGNLITFVNPCCVYGLDLTFLNYGRLKFVFNLCEETISRTDEGQPRPKYIFNKCWTNIYFFTLQRFGPSPSPNFKSIIHVFLIHPVCIKHLLIKTWPLFIFKHSLSTLQYINTLDLRIHFSSLNKPGAKYWYFLRKSVHILDWHYELE